MNGLAVYDVDAAKPNETTIPIGNRGENLVTRICFDISAWREEYGDGNVTALLQRKGDLQPYVVELQVDEDIATWLVTSTDTGVEGIGQFELQFFVDEVLKKSGVWKTYVRPALGKAGDTPLAPGGIEVMTELAAEAQASADAARHSAEEAAASETAAAASQEAAAASETSAATSAADASDSAVDAGLSASGAADSAAAAEAAATAAASSEQNAAASETNAADSAAAAQASETNAAASETSAAASAEAAKAAEDAVAENAGKAEAAASAAQSSETNAAQSETNAAASETAAAQSAASAQTSMQQAGRYTEYAGASAELADSSAQAAAQSANAAEMDASVAQSSANDSESSATLARSWAVGGTGARTDEEYNNSRYWAQQAQEIVGGDFVTHNELYALEGAANGLATLGGDGKVPSGQLPPLDYIPTGEKGEAGGVATLGENGKVPSSQLPPLDYIPADEKGEAGGVASLGEDGKVPSAQLPAQDYVPNAQKGVANGVATLGADGKVPSSQLPSLDYVTTTQYENEKGAADGIATLDSSGKVPDEQLPEQGIAFDSIYYDSETGLFHIYDENGEDVVDPTYIGGGGGGGGATSTVHLTNENGTSTITAAVDSSVILRVKFTSTEDEIPTGDGTCRVAVGGVLKTSFTIHQNVTTEIEIGEYLSAGTNSVRVTAVDVNNVSKSLAYTVEVVDLRVTSAFDDTAVYADAISFRYTPYGAIEKTVHFLVDGAQIGTQTVTTSGRQQTYSIPQQSHGSHTLQVYASAVIGEETILSNTLYYDLICVEAGETATIITSDYHQSTAEQYETLTIDYMVYDPTALTADVTVTANGTAVSSVTVDRTRQTLSYRCDSAGTLTLVIAANGTSKTFTLTVAASSIDVHAETQDLALYLKTAGRSNNEAHPEVWTSEVGDIACTLSGFNFTSDGWQLDGDGNTALRVQGSARVTIPYRIFGSDFRATGKTIEFEFETRDVLDYDATLISCMSGGRGFSLTPQIVTMASEQSEITTQYKEDEHVRVSIVVEKRSENRLISVYINGVQSRVIQYPDGDDFSQVTPVDITIGSSSCTLDLYTVRVYDNDLTRYQVLDNWIADSQLLDDMLTRYEHNHVYDDYGNVVIANLPDDLPYLILTCPELPQYKGDNKTVDAAFYDPSGTWPNWTSEGADANVQGTSSQYYARKNYKIKFQNGFVFDDGTTASKIPLREGQIPVKTFCFKADVASSEGANNTVLARLYGDICPYKTPAQENDARVRQGIDGFPIVIFWNDGNTTSFLGKYNQNLDKGSEEVFGFVDGDESWEIKNNTSDRVIWKNDDYTSTVTDDKGNVTPAWLNDFEARYPDTKPAYADAAQLSAFASWVKSTDTTVAGLSDEEKAARLQKFRDELEDWVELDSALFYYLWTELFLMVDSRAKNAFPSFMGSDNESEASGS